MNFTNHKIRKFLRVNPTYGNLYAVRLTDEQVITLRNDLNNLDSEEFKSKYKINKSDVILYGDIIDVTTDMKEVVCGVQVVSTKSGDVKIYNCFTRDASHTFKLSGINLHENLDSSWNCFIETMAFPDNVVIYRSDENSI